MDWTMVDDAKTAIDCIRTIFYLCWLRYEADAREAGTRLANEPPNNDLCKRVINEMRAELDKPSANLGPVATVGDARIRKYLKGLLSTYDESASQI